jgi:hypothetical protein
MKPLASPLLLALLLALGLASFPLRADDGQISAERLDLLDRGGYFTPGFKTAVHGLVNIRTAKAEANAEKARLAQKLPGLQDQATKAEAQTVALRQELAKYNHPEENDFIALQGEMQDSKATLKEQIEAAQAYIWAYATSPHEAQAQQYLEQAQKELADRQETAKQAEAARVAAHAQLIQRAKAHDLRLNEWRDLLGNMSQDDLVELIGQPSSQTGDYWIYSGGWVVDPATHQKAGLEINFNGGRVLTVDEISR